MTVPARPMDGTVATVVAQIWGPSWQTARVQLSCPRCGSLRLGRSLIAFVCWDCAAKFQAIPRERLKPPRVPMAIWVLALYLILNGASIRQLLILGVSYKTAWRMARFILRTIEVPPAASRRRVRSAVIQCLLLDARDRRALEARLLLRETVLLFFEVSSEWKGMQAG